MLKPMSEIAGKMSVVGALPGSHAGRAGLLLGGVPGGPAKVVILGAGTVGGA
jgi:alanine dehydrogenase